MSKRRVSFNGVEVEDPIDMSTIGSSSGRRFHREKKRVTATSSGLRGISGGTFGLLRRIRAVVAKALRISSMSKKSSRKVTAATATGGLGRSRSCGGGHVAVGVDSQRAEAIDDCIEFFKSSLQRTNSVSTVSTVVTVLSAK